MNPSRKAAIEADALAELEADAAERPAHHRAGDPVVLEIARLGASMLLLLVLLLGALGAAGQWLESRQLAAAYGSCLEVCGSTPAEVGSEHCVCRVERTAVPPTP